MPDFQPAAAPAGRLDRVVTLPPPGPGFAGPFHTAVDVVRPDALAATNPFVLLMDDRLDVAAPRRVGGPHPHAGLETVTLVLEGTLHDRDEGELGPGDLVWMTAGRGIIHNESVEVSGRARVLQLWIGLPAALRDAPPAFELVRRDAAPVRREPGATARLYSGTAGSLSSRTHNHVPVTLVDFTLEPGAAIDQALPAFYNGFVYVLAGAVQVGDTTVAIGQVGWLAQAPEASTLRLVASDAGARVVLYAGQPHGSPLMQHGPFVAGSSRELAAMFRDYEAGHFVRMSTLHPRSA